MISYLIWEWVGGGESKVSSKAKQKNGKCVCTHMHVHVKETWTERENPRALGSIPLTHFPNASQWLRLEQGQPETKIWEPNLISPHGSRNSVIESSVLHSSIFIRLRDTSILTPRSNTAPWHQISGSNPKRSVNIKCTYSHHCKNQSWEPVIKMKALVCKPHVWKNGNSGISWKEQELKMSTLSTWTQCMRGGVSTTEDTPTERKADA